jgi:hypothetical protein
VADHEARLLRIERAAPPAAGRPWLLPAPGQGV